MDEYRWNNYHVPAFGSWDYGNENLPYTQCFESARQVSGVGSLVRYGSYNSDDVQDTDLYVAGDLYQNDVVTPAVILVPRPRLRKGGSQNVKGGSKKEQKQKWGDGGYSYDIKEQHLSQVISPTKPPQVSKSKPIDQDLYQVPPEFYHLKPRKKRGFGLFSSCLQPTCV
ncbi:hypothetical protein RND81_10G234400 [Saponaria officinalis]|uniref:Uncharacterized protein n=1 Tax=Saponaria officinalis TaxID=3572 RepID=A0AAW1I5P6_SAPOF